MLWIWCDPVKSICVESLIFSAVMCRGEASGIWIHQIRSNLDNSKSLNGLTDWQIFKLMALGWRDGNLGDGA